MAVKTDAKLIMNDMNKRFSDSRVQCRKVKKIKLNDDEKE